MPSLSPIFVFHVKLLILLTFNNILGVPSGFDVLYRNSPLITNDVFYFFRMFLDRNILSSFNVNNLTIYDIKFNIFKKKIYIGRILNSNIFSLFILICKRNFIGSSDKIL